MSAKNAADRERSPRRTNDDPHGQRRPSRKRNAKRKNQNFSTLLDRALARKTTVSVNGEILSLTRQQRMVRQLVYAAAKGDMTAVMHVLTLKKRAMRRGDIPAVIVRYVDDKCG